MDQDLTAADKAFNLGDFDRAEILYAEAMRAKLRHPSTLKNLATIALYKNRSDVALRLTKEVPSASQESSEFLHLPGLILLTAGYVDKAEAALRHAILLAPDDSRLANTFGHALLQSGRCEDAVQQFYKAAKANDGVIEYWRDLEQGLGSLSNNLFLRNNIGILTDLLGIQAVNRKKCSILARQIAQPLLEELYVVLRSNEFGAIQEWIADRYLEDNFQLLIALVENTPCADQALENFLTTLRTVFSSEVNNIKEISSLNFLAALASQCILNSYAFYISDSENNLASRLQKDVQEILTNGGVVSPQYIALYATYRPLHTLRDVENIIEAFPLEEGIKTRFTKLFRMQITEPIERQKRRSEIPALTGISNEISIQIRDQYEESPYPLWQGARWQTNELPIGFRQSTPNPINRNRGEGHRVLIAGCGTGQHAYVYSLALPKADITAIDLSLDSLAYAEQKKLELCMQNVTFCQGDILRLPETGLEFDEISCIGVLHHLQNPLDGLIALRRVFTGEGEFRLAVYTESGRADVVSGIKLREQERFSSTPKDIRRFRKRVLELDEKHQAKRLVKWGDFYSLDACRDLIFNVQEHRFNLMTLSKLIVDAGFVLSSIRTKPRVKDLYHKKYSDTGDEINIQNWYILEQENPGIFGSMYDVNLSIR